MKQNLIEPTYILYQKLFRLTRHGFTHLFVNCNNYTYNMYTHEKHDKNICIVESRPVSRNGHKIIMQSHKTFEIQFAVVNTRSLQKQTYQMKPAKAGGQTYSSQTFFRYFRFIRRLVRKKEQNACNHFPGALSGSQAVIDFIPRFYFFSGYL